MEENDKEKYWDSVMTGDPAMVPDSLKLSSDSEEWGIPRDEYISRVANRSWAVDYLGKTREEVRNNWKNIRSQLAQRFVADEENETELFSAISEDRQDWNAARKSVREWDALAYEKGFDGEDLPDAPDLSAYSEVQRNSMRAIAQQAYMDGLAERKRLSSVAKKVWNGMKAIYPHEVPKNDADKVRDLIGAVTPLSMLADGLNTCAHMPDLVDSVDLLRNLEKEDRQKVYRLLQKRYAEKIKNGNGTGNHELNKLLHLKEDRNGESLLDQVGRSLKRGVRDTLWNMVQGGGNLAVYGMDEMGGESGTLWGIDLRGKAETTDARLRMLEEMRRALATEIVPLNTDEHASWAEKTLVDAAGGVAPAALTLAGGAGFATLALSGLGSSVADARQRNSEGNRSAQLCASLGAGIADAGANVLMSRTGLRMLNRSLKQFAEAKSAGSSVKAWLGAAGRTAKLTAIDATQMIATNKASELSDLGIHEIAAQTGDYDSGIDWKQWRENLTDHETFRREVASILPFLLIGAGRTALHHFRSPSSVLGNGARLREWGVPSESIRRILQERDRVRQGKMLQEAIRFSPLWCGPGFISQTQKLLRLMNEGTDSQTLHTRKSGDDPMAMFDSLPKGIFLNDDAVRDFLNIPADYQPNPLKKNSKEIKKLQKNFNEKGLLLQGKRAKNAFAVWDSWWQRSGLLRMEKDGMPILDYTECGQKFLTREKMNLRELAVENVAEILPERSRSEGGYQPHMAEDARILMYDRIRDVRERPFKLLMARESLDGLLTKDTVGKFWEGITKTTEDKIKTITFEGVMRLWRGEKTGVVLRDVARDMWDLWTAGITSHERINDGWLSSQPIADKLSLKKKGISDRFAEACEMIRLKYPETVNELSPDFRQACRMVWGEQADVRMLHTLMPLLRDYDVAMSRGMTPEQAYSHLLRRELDLPFETIRKNKKYFDDNDETLWHEADAPERLARRYAPYYDQYEKLSKVKAETIEGDDGKTYWRTMYPDGKLTRWHGSREAMLADWGAHLAWMFSPIGDSKLTLLSNWSRFPVSKQKSKDFMRFIAMRGKRGRSVFDLFTASTAYDLLKRWYGGLSEMGVDEEMNTRTATVPLENPIRDVIRARSRVKLFGGNRLGVSHDPIPLDNPIALMQGKSDAVWNRVLQTQSLKPDEALRFLKAYGDGKYDESLLKRENRDSLIAELTELTKTYFLGHVDDPDMPPMVRKWFNYLRTIKTISPDSINHYLEENEHVGSFVAANLRVWLRPWKIRAAVDLINRENERAQALKDTEMKGSIEPRFLSMLRDAAGLNRGVRAERAWTNEIFPEAKGITPLMDRIVHMLLSGEPDKPKESMSLPSYEVLRGVFGRISATHGILSEKDAAAQAMWSERTTMRLKHLAEALKKYPDLQEWSFDDDNPGKFRKILFETEEQEGDSFFGRDEYTADYKSVSTKKDYVVQTGLSLPKTWQDDPNVVAAIRTLDALRRVSRYLPSATSDGVLWKKRLYSQSGENRPRGVDDSWSVHAPLEVSRALLRSVDGKFEHFNIKLLGMGKEDPPLWKSMVIYRDPKEPGHVVRLMPGFPDASNVLARSPYVVHSYKGKYLDEDGFPVSMTRMYRSYIPLERFRMKWIPDVVKHETSPYEQTQRLMNYMQLGSQMRRIDRHMDFSRGAFPNLLEYMLRMEEELGLRERWSKLSLDRMRPEDLFLLKAYRNALKHPELLFNYNMDGKQFIKRISHAVAKAWTRLYDREQEKKAKEEERKQKKIEQNNGDE